MDTSQRSLRVLVVSPSFPDQPGWGFARRVHHLTHGLAARHDVTVLAYRPTEELDGRTRERRVGGLRFIAAPSPEGSGKAKRLHQALSLASRSPFHAAQLRSAAMQQAFDDEVGRADVVLMESSQMGWLRVPVEVPVVVDEHNIESELLGRMALSESGRSRRAYNRWEHVRYRAFERQLWNRADACTATSDRDAQAIRNATAGRTVTVVPNGVDPEEFRPAGTQVEQNSIVFTGLLSYRPNLEGITWFIDEVMPAILRSEPRAHLTIVGDGAPEVLAALRRPGVTTTGWVTDVRPLIQSAAVAVVPLRVGGGTRLKVVEAMSMAKAIVSTSLGSEGLDVQSGVHVELVDDAPGFAGAVLGLLADPTRAAHLGHQARVRAKERYSWDRAADSLESALREVARPPHPSSSA